MLSVLISLVFQERFKRIDITLGRKVKLGAETAGFKYFHGHEAM